MRDENTKPTEISSSDLCDCRHYRVQHSLATKKCGECLCGNFRLFEAVAPPQAAPTEPDCPNPDVCGCKSRLGRPLKLHVSRETLRDQIANSPDLPIEAGVAPQAEAPTDYKEAFEALTRVHQEFSMKYAELVDLVDSNYKSAYKLNLIELENTRKIASRNLELLDDISRELEEGNEAEVIVQRIEQIMAKLEEK